MIIPVFFNTDNDFVVPTYISLFSLLYNYRGTSEIHAYIFVGNDFSDKNKFLLNSLSKKFDFIKISIIDLKDCYNNVSLQLGHTTKASVYRLIIPRFASSLNTSQMDTCIYLDSDLVVVGNISELFNIDINGYYVAGVGAPARFRKKDTSLKDILAIPSLDKYINSGVLLFNLREINNCNGLKERLEKSGYREDFFYRDQDAINSVLYDKN